MYYHFINFLFKDDQFLATVGAVTSVFNCTGKTVGAVTSVFNFTCKIEPVINLLYLPVNEMDRLKEQLEL